MSNSRKGVNSPINVTALENDEMLNQADSNSIDETISSKESSNSPHKRNYNLPI
jgi:hypothetical protein